jgi:hypothetical protein
MLALGEARLKDYIRTIGLYNTKAKNIIKLSEILLPRPWRPGAIRNERAARPDLQCRRRPQDCERGPERAFGNSTHGGRHPHLPLGTRIRDLPGAPKTPARSRADADMKRRAREYAAQRPSLADPARATLRNGAALARFARPARRVDLCA